jgi:putative DNA-invertase from lambdoid prophage Rac
MREEESRSGAGVVRPGLQRVLQAARAGRIDVVACWKLDRWGRSVIDLLSNIRTLTTAGVRFVAISQGLDVRPHGDAVSDLLVNMLASVSEFERSLIRERTRLGVAKARARGQRLGRPKLQHPTPARVHELRRKGKSWTRWPARSAAPSAWSGCGPQRVQADECPPPSVALVTRRPVRAGVL